MTASRLLRENRPSIRADVYDQLYRAVSLGASEGERGELLADLDLAIVSPEMAKIIEAYKQWRRERAGRFMRRRGARFSRSKHGVDAVKTGQRPKSDSEFGALLEQEVKYGQPPLAGSAVSRDADYAHLLSSLPPAVVDRLEAFGRKQLRLGHDVMRVDLAALRILEPLLECAESAFVERGANELTAEEMLRFVNAGIVRETILLDRATDEERADELSHSRPPGRARA